MTDKRLLAVYDLAVQPDTVGQMCLFLSAVQVLVEYFHLKKADICLVLNANSPSARWPEKETALEQALRLLPCVQFCPCAGSAFIREDMYQLQLQAASPTYADVWPPPDFRQSLLAPSLDLLTAYYEAVYTVPRPVPRNVMLAWSRDFYAAHVLPCLPVTVAWDTVLTPQTELAGWADFFSRCQDQYPVKFILLSPPVGAAELFSGLRNVIFAQDYFVTLEQEITLVVTALTHLGSYGDLAIVANLAGKVLTLFNFPAQPTKDTTGALLDGGTYWRYKFASPEQRFWPASPEADRLITEIERIWDITDRQAWLVQQQTLTKIASNMAMWLR